MKVTLWGTRGSLASPGPETVRYGGNTSCVEVRGRDGGVLVLDAGTGIRRLGVALEGSGSRVDVLLTHLHMDHLQGLGFFAPLYEPDREVHIWGPASTTQDLRARLARYLSPPLFPVRLRELPCSLEVHDVPIGTFSVGAFDVTAALVCHPGPTMGYRVTFNDTTMTYLSDHEPALGWRDFPGPPGWTSGFALARDADLLVHDAQYTAAEYDEHVGWGHSSLDQAVAFAAHAGVQTFVTFHHDPDHADAMLDGMLDDARRSLRSEMQLVAGTEGLSLQVSRLHARR